MPQPRAIDTGLPLDLYPASSSDAVTSVVGRNGNVFLTRSPAIGRAGAGDELAQALERHRKESASRADGSAFLPVEQDVVHLGQVDWARIRFAENFGARAIAWDDYYRPWDEDYLLHLQIRYGTQLGGDAGRIAALRQLAEEAIAGLQVQ